MIPLVDLVAQYHSIQPEIDAAIKEVLNSGRFILGPNVSAFETEVADYIGVQHGIGVASGTDALVLSLRAVGIGAGDEVIVPAYSFFASAGAIMLVGARPVFIDIHPLTYCLDVTQLKQKLTKKTKAVIAVHLYGHPADMKPIKDFAEQYDLKIIEDNAQAFGAEYLGKKTGSLGVVACLSFFPTKNLGGYGDGGMVVTDNDEIADKARMLRTHGWQKKYFPEMLGYNSRLDELQAAILRVKLRYLDEWNQRRREIAAEYSMRLQKLGITIPVEQTGARHVYHLYIIRMKNRDKVREYLKEQGIATDVYYPQPLHLTKTCQSQGFQPGDMPISEQASRDTLALPLFAEMTSSKVDQVIHALVSMGT